MSLYISNRQLNRAAPTGHPYVPVLLERPETALQHRIYPADFELSPLLLDAYELTNTDNTDLYYPILPSTCPILILKFNRSMICSALCGVTTSLKKLHIPPKFTVFCLRFRPGVLKFLTGESAKNLTDSSVPMETYFPHTSLLLNQIRSGESFHERNIRIHQYLRSRLDLSACTPPQLLGSVEKIHASQGNIRITDLAAEAGCSERYLGRIFQEHIGCSPKLYCEITRMQFSLNDILVTRPKSLIRTAVSYGYFDQPHMNRSYQKLLGRTASDMRFFDDSACSVSSISVIL